MKKKLVSVLLDEEDYIKLKEIIFKNFKNSGPKLNMSIFIIAAIKKEMEKYAEGKKL